MKKLLIMLAMIMLVLLNVKSWSQDSAVEQEISVPFSPMKSKNIRTLLSAFGVNSVEINTFKNELDAAIVSFKESDEYGELSIQQLLNILSAEMGVVGGLLWGTTSCASVVGAEKRNDFLSCSIPSVVYVYDKIMDYATFNTKIDPETLRLSYDDKREFLLHARDTLEYYHTMFIALQHEESIVPNESFRSLNQKNEVKDRNVSDFSPVRLS